jgi:hypothetical protein
MAQGSLSGSSRIWAAVGLIALATACTAPSKSPPAPPPAAQAPPPPPPVVRPPQALGSRDSCGADPLQYLVGRPHTEIPVPINPNLRRVVCSTCVISQDHIPARQTIVYDAQNGLVQSVKCG